MGSTTVTAPWLLLPVGAAAIAAAAVGWHAGALWGAAAYVAVGAVVLVGMGVARALIPEKSGNPGPSSTNGPGRDRSNGPVRRSDARSSHDHRSRLADRLKVGGERKDAVVFRVIAGAGGEGGAVTLGHLPQPRQARFQQEVVGTGVQ